MDTTQHNESGGLAGDLLHGARAIRVYLALGLPAKPFRRARDGPPVARRPRNPGPPGGSRPAHETLQEIPR